VAAAAAGFVAGFVAGDTPAAAAAGSIKSSKSFSRQSIFISISKDGTVCK
jgi:hypothetical protein